MDSKGQSHDEITRNIRDEVMSETQEALDRHGLTADYFIRRLKREISAKETKIVKVKKNADADRVIEEILKATGIDNEKKVKGIKALYETTEELVLAVDLIAWGVRQSARIDGQKLRGMYPAEKHEVTHRHESALEELDD